MTNDEKNNEEKKELMPIWNTGFGNLDKVFDNFKKDFEQILAPSFITKPLFSDMSGTSMTCNITDEGDKFVITTDLPRIKKDEVNIDVGDDYVEISAEHKESEEEKKKKYLRKEQSEISVRRRMSLPEKVKSSDVKAKLDNGVLTVNLPKEEPTPQPKSTKIHIE